MRRRIARRRHRPYLKTKNLAQKYPSRYQKTETGHWHCPPGEAYAASYGLKYHVRTDTELNPIFTQNLMFLEDYFRFTANIPHFITEQILAAVQATRGTTIAATLTSIPGVRANDIYAMIATEQVCKFTRQGYQFFNNVRIGIQGNY
ncbi:hypothetical protein ACWATR_38935 [Nostoc sp. UIC 10890]